MMDKEIIIDGVNVAGCIYFQQEDDEYTCGAEECNGAVVGCRACDNCYYKQLKRKEQEIAKLKAENERLKEENINLKWQQESDYQMVEDAETLIYDNDFYKREMDKYKQTLQEIKEICNWQRDCGVTNDNMEGYYEILDKIDKAEEE